MRGSESTGQVLAYFTTSGTAVLGASGDKKSDYRIIDPADGQPVVFVEGQNEATIHLSIAASKGAEAAQTIKLTLLSIVGDADSLDADSPYPRSAVTVTIHDAQPAGLSKPGALRKLCLN